MCQITVNKHIKFASKIRWPDFPLCSTPAAYVGVRPSGKKYEFI